MQRRNATKKCKKCSVAHSGAPPSLGFVAIIIGNKINERNARKKCREEMQKIQCCTVRSGLRCNQRDLVASGGGPGTQIIQYTVTHNFQEVHNSWENKHLKVFFWVVLIQTILFQISEPVPTQLIAQPDDLCYCPPVLAIVTRLSHYLLRYISVCGILALQPRLVYI